MVENGGGGGRLLGFCGELWSAFTDKKDLKGEQIGVRTGWG